MTAQQMWHQFARETGISAEYDAWAFCGGGEIGDRLAKLVLDGIKTATASAYISYQIENESIPKAGSYSVVLYDSGEAACIIQTNKVNLVPFDEVSAQRQKSCLLAGSSQRGFYPRLCSSRFGIR